MKKLLVHLHLYYPEIYKELESCILNLTPEFDFDLFVTIPEKNLNLKPQILSTFPKAQIQVVENLGYDIFPFIKVIKSVNIDDYSYVIKLHTKRDLNKFKYDLFSITKTKWFGNSNWREGLLTFIKTKEKHYCPSLSKSSLILSKPANLYIFASSIASLILLQLFKT